MSERRKGKVARLPYEIRTGVNVRLRDGLTYADIAKWLTESGHKEDWNDQNFTNWKDGGHQDWLKEQERLEDMKFKREFALQVVKDNEGSKIHEATMQLAASQLYEVLTDFEIAPLHELLAEKPALYPKIVNSIAKLSKEALGYEKYREHVRGRKEEIEKVLKQRDAKGGLAAETIERIERELNLL